MILVFLPRNFLPMAGIYVHIPFCRSRCVYCAFCSTVNLSLRERYTEAVVREYAMRSGYLSGETVETVYIGGGTPSLLSPRDMEKLFAALPPRASLIETTMECNPDDVTPGFVSLIRSLGVNRVSMGVQTLTDDRLRVLHRRHTAAGAYAAVECLRHGGIGNISIDLMFGFPGHTVRECLGDVNRAAGLGVEHISAYGLSYEKGTPLYGMLQRGIVKETGEEASRAMYYALVDRLAALGYMQYEISNFCRQGSRSLHNSNYWRGVPYLGLGASAHSFDRASRQWNTSDVELYINSVKSGCLPFEREQLTPDTAYNDMIVTALRTAEGISLEDPFHNKSFLLESAQPLIARGLLSADNRRLRLTRKGLYISDSIMAELIKC